MITSQSFAFGKITMDKRFVMSKSEMESFSDETYPDCFPVWCTDDQRLYWIHKSEDGSSYNVVDDLHTSDQVLNYVLFPVMGEDNIISWEYRTVDANVIPEPMKIVSQPGKSAYQLWLEEGNDGSVEDFFAYLASMALRSLSTSDIEYLKSVLGINDIESDAQAMRQLIV